MPIPEPQGGNNCPGVETTQPHRVVIASEEQFKMFMLPTLKPCGKYKLTAHEGSRVRKVGFITFPSKVRKICFLKVLLFNRKLGDPKLVHPIQFRMDELS